MKTKSTAHTNNFTSLITILLLTAYCLLPTKTQAQSFYDIDTIQKIEITFSQANWDYILDTSKLGSDSYTMARWVKINGVQFDSAGVKYKGNSSYNPNNVKNPLHIELDYVKSQDYQGYKDIKLSNGFKDPSFVREVLAYDILRNYMQASLSNYAQVYINGQYIGLYANTEAVTKTFVDSHFFSNTNSFFFMDNFGGSLFYKGSDSTFYYTTYTMKSDYGWADLINLCNTLKNNINGIENILDVDRALWMLVYDNVLVNLDSYIGQPEHNYYIYEDHNGRFNPIVWDVNEAFGNFTNAGTGSPLTISQEQTMPPMLHSNDPPWPLVNKLLAVPMFKRMYIAHIRTIVSENFANSSYYTYSQYLQTIIDTAIQSDQNTFYTYLQFHDNLTTNVTSGPFTAPGITYLMDARSTYLNSTTEFQQVPPTISNIQPSDTFPLINSNIYITANVTNATSVFLGLRYSVMERFYRLIMYDDGLHGDGAAGDGTYGISVPVTSPEIHYYIYAENNEAGIFSPERAEHEYYTIDADYATINAGGIVINEIMAVNNTTVQNNNGQYSDWVEIYNNTADSVSLDYLNLSDDVTNPTRWQFPADVIIPPYGFLIVWADNDTSSSELHCDFKFSGSGEHAVISYSNGYVVDSISFPAQSTDITWGRYPNGTGPFVFMPPTFNATNSLSSVEELLDENGIIYIYIYPNPTNGTVSLYSTVSGLQLKIFDVLGNIIFQKTLNSKHETLNFNLPGGMYFYQLKNEQQVIKNGKIIIQ
ncbi:MAG: CotH kinase family protein [Bacteroidales bacterium]